MKNPLRQFVAVLTLGFMALFAMPAAMTGTVNTPAQNIGAQDGVAAHTPTVAEHATTRQRRRHGGILGRLTLGLVALAMSLMKLDSLKPRTGKHQTSPKVSERPPTAGSSLLKQFQFLAVIGAFLTSMIATCGTGDTKDRRFGSGSFGDLIRALGDKTSRLGIADERGAIHIGTIPGLDVVAKIIDRNHGADGARKQPGVLRTMFGPLLGLLTALTIMAPSLRSQDHLIKKASGRGDVIGKGSAAAQQTDGFTRSDGAVAIHPGVADATQ